MIYVTATGSGNAVTVNTPDGGFQDNELYRFISPITNSGAITINGRPVLGPDAAQITIAASIVVGGDVIVRFQLNGSAFHLVYATPGVDLRILNEVATLTSSDPNNLVGTTPSARQIPVVGTRRSFVTGSTANSGPVRLTLNGYGYPIGKNGAVPLAAGDLPANSLIIVEFTAASIYRLISNGSVGDADILDGLYNTFVNEPWGALSFDSTSTVQATPRHFTVSGCGSSVGQDDPSKNGGAPSGYAANRLLCNAFNAAWPLGGVVLDNDNQSIGGQALTQFAAQLANSTAASVSARKLITCVAGMNDFVPGGYNSNQSFPGARDALISLIGQCISANVPLVLFTSPHPNTPQYDYNFFAQVTSAPEVYPIYRAAPVDNSTQVYPPVAISKITRDWTGSGIAVEGDVRFWHGNNMLRTIARRYQSNVFLLDAEWAWFRYGVEPRGNCSALYDSGSVVHPNVLGHQVSFQRVIREFVAHFVGQRIDDKRLFRGDTISA